MWVGKSPDMGQCCFGGVGFGRKGGQDQRPLISWALAVARFWR